MGRAAVPGRSFRFVATDCSPDTSFQCRLREAASPGRASLNPRPRSRGSPSAATVCSIVEMDSAPAASPEEPQSEVRYRLLPVGRGSRRSSPKPPACACAGSPPPAQHPVNHRAQRPPEHVTRSQQAANNPEMSPSFVLRELAIFAVPLALYAEVRLGVYPLVRYAGFP